MGDRVSGRCPALHRLIDAVGAKPSADDDLGRHLAECEVCSAFVEVLSSVRSESAVQRRPSADQVEQVTAALQDATEEGRVLSLLPALFESAPTFMLATITAWGAVIMGGAGADRATLIPYSMTVGVLVAAAEWRLLNSTR